ncbi:MAG: alpha/beta fold hydrolase [Anaerolineae bacterium]
MAAYRFRGEDKVLDAEARKIAPGQFVHLPDGVVHYELAGPSDGQPVVLIHGFSVPYYIWDPTFPALAEAGFRPLRYDLYGRGFSDRPETEYNLDLFVRQLWNLLRALGVERAVDVVGLSMGGPIAVSFTDRYPERVRKLVLIDPAGLPFAKPILGNLITLPWLGEWLMDLLFERVMVNSQGNDFVHPERFPDFRQKYLPQTSYVGFRRALLSTLRGDVLHNHTSIYRRVGQQGCPILLIWGRLDKTIPFETHRKVLEVMPEAEFHPIDDTGHVPHYECPEVVNPILVEFLRR